LISSISLSLDRVSSIWGIFHDCTLWKDDKLIS